MTRIALSSSVPHLGVEMQSLRQLAPADRAAWRALCAGDPRQASPFLWPDFAEAVASVRDDVRLAIFRGAAAQYGGPAPALGFFAFHRRPHGLARPAGAPIADWQGPVLARDVVVTPQALAAACGADVVRFTGVRPDLCAVRGSTHRQARSWFIDLGAGGPAYLDALKRTQSKHLSNTARCGRKAEREIGPVRYCFHDPNPAVFEQVIAWKRERFRATGKHDIFAARWIRALFDRLAQSPSPEFGLVVSSVYFGDRLAAGEIYLRGGDQLHAWIASYDRALMSFAPGQILTERMIAQANAHGVRRIDFGAGNDEYKSRWCLDADPIAEAVVHAPTPGGVMRARALSGWRHAQPALGRASEIVTRARGRTEYAVATHGSWIVAAGALALTLFARRQGAL